MPKKLNDDLQAILPDARMVGDESGRRLRLWAETGSDRKPSDQTAVVVRDLIERIQDAPTLDVLHGIEADAKVIEQRAWLQKNRPDLAQSVTDAIAAAENIFAGEGESDDQQDEAA